MHLCMAEISENIWQGAETRGEGYDGMRMELLRALAKIERADPKVARVLRKCVSEKAASRPSARTLLKAMRALRTDATPLRRVIVQRGRGWGAKKDSV